MLSEPGSAWSDGGKDLRVASCPLTEKGCVTNHVAIEGPNAVPTREVIERLREAAATSYRDGGFAPHI
jgi:hypothetical protein